MISTKRIFGYALMLVFFLLSSCLEYDESLVISKDGSGHVRQVLQLENRFYDNLLKSGKFPLTRAAIESTMPPGAKIIEFSIQPLGNQRRIITVGVFFEDMNTVFEMAQRGQANFVGELKWEKDYLGRIKYRRILKKKGETILGERGGPNDGLIKYGMDKGFLANYTMTFSLESPYRVVRANAEKVEGGKIKWNVPVADLLNTEKEVILTALLEKPRNMFLIGGIYGLVILAVFSLIFFLFWKKKY